MVPGGERIDGQARIHPAHGIQSSRTLPHPLLAQWLSISDHSEGDQRLAQPQGRYPHGDMIGSQQRCGNGVITTNTLHRVEDLTQRPNQSSSTTIPRFPEPKQWDRTPELNYQLPPMRPWPPEASTLSNPTSRSRNAASMGFVEGWDQDSMLRPGTTAIRASRSPPILPLQGWL